MLAASYKHQEVERVKQNRLLNIGIDDHLIF